MQAGGENREGERQRHLSAVAARASGLAVEDIWLRYFSIGGAAGEYEIDAYLNASLPLPVLQRDLLAQAVNELIDELPSPPRAPYSTDSSSAEPDQGPVKDTGVNPAQPGQSGTGKEWRPK